MRCPAIIQRIDAALATMAAREMEPRAIYLTPDDREALATAKTKRYRQETGSAAFLWPCSYGDVPIVNAAGVTRIESAIPVRETENRSVVYSTHGVGVQVPQRVSAV